MSGQASSEYVALLAFVAVVLVLARGLTSGGIGPRVMAGLQRGLCLVARQACPAPTRAAADLEPCQLARSTRTEQLSETIGLVRLGSTGTLGAARTSDGRVAVTLAAGSAAGAEAGVGARLRLSDRAVGGRLRAAVTATWASGRTWRFANTAAARDFVARYGSKATIGGQLVDAVRSRCSLLCDAIGWRPHPRLPKPDETYGERGAAATLAAELGDGPADATARGDTAHVLGWRLDRDGTRTWYVPLDHSVVAGLDAWLAGGSASALGEGVLSYSVDVRGQPQRLEIEETASVKASAALGDEAALHAGVRGAVVMEHDATLDLHDPANRVAARGMLDVLIHPGIHAIASVRAALLARRIRDGGIVDRRTYVLSERTTGVGAGVALGAELAGGFDRTTEGLRLLSAETRLPGLPFLPRDDCRSA